MTVIVIGELPDAETAARVQQELGGAGREPARGALARFDGPTATGYRIISVWESMQDYQPFRRERLVPAFERAGVPFPPSEADPLDNFRVIPQQTATAAPG